MNDIKVSIIIPFRNVEEYITTCLESVSNQTLRETEIICINDCSSDSSLEIVNNFASRDSRFKIINLPEMHGQGYARNIGIDNAQGEFIGFVDSDDWVETTMFEKLYNRAKESDSDISMCKTILFNEKTQSEYFDGYYQLDEIKPFWNKKFNADDVKENILKINVSIWNKIYKKEFLNNLNIRFPAGYIYEDLPFFFETFLKANALSIVAENLYYYRINRPGSTMQNVGSKICNRIDMLECSFEHIKNYHAFSEIESIVINWIVEDVFERASIIIPQYFEDFFNKAKEFLKKIGFDSRDKLKDKGIIFLDETLFWIEKTPEEALFFTKNYRTIDKKLDKLYSELEKIKVITDDKIHLVFNEITQNYEYTNSEIAKCTLLNEQKKEELQNTLQNYITEKTENWSQNFNNELAFVTHKMSEQFIKTEENMNKILYVQKQNILSEQAAQNNSLENLFKEADIISEEKMLKTVDETIQALIIRFEEEKKNIEEEYNTKLNEQKIKYERKITKLEEDYNNFYKKLKPILKILKFFNPKKEGKDGK